MTAPRPAAETLAGLTIHRLAGRGGASTVLISHANGFHGRCYVELAEAIDACAPGGADVVAVDHRGHGATPVPARWPGGGADRNGADDVGGDHVGDDHVGDAVDWRVFGADALTVATTLVERAGRPIVGFGHSLGGSALLMAAHRAPELFERLVLFEPIAGPPRPGEDMSDSPLVQITLRRRAWFADRQTAFDNFARKPPLAQLTERALREYVEHGLADDGDGSVVLCCPPALEAAIYVAGLSNGVWELLPEVRVPTLVAAGQLEGEGPWKWAESIAERIPAGGLVVRSELDHLAPLAHPADVAALVFDD